MAKEIDYDAINYADSSLDSEYITAREYEDATRTVVRTIGRDAGCDVLFAGEQAKAGDKDEQRVVVLPANDPDARMTKRQYFVGQGYANHETLHNLCTDITGLAPRMKDLEKVSSILQLHLPMHSRICVSKTLVVNYTPASRVSWIQLLSLRRNTS